MSTANRSRIAIVLALPLGFVAGRFSVGNCAETATGNRVHSAPVLEASSSPSGSITLSAKVVEANSGLAASATLDPAATMKSLMATVAKEPPGLARLALLHEVLQRITLENWHDALVVMWDARSNGLISEQEMRYVQQRIGEAAGGVALEHYKPPDPVTGSETHWGRFAMMGWALKDPAAAKAWLETQPAGRYRDGMLWGFTLGTGLRDAPAALRAMQTLEPAEQTRLLQSALSDVDGQRYEALAEAWLTANNANAPRGVREQDDDVSAVYDSLLSRQLQNGMVVKKNDKFVAWADTLADKPWLGPQNITTIAQEFARRQAPGKGFDWVARITKDQPAAAEGATGRIMWAWAQQDATGAATWLNNHSASPLHDHAVIVFLDSQRGRLDANTTQAWVNSIRDESQRTRALKMFR